MEPKEIVIISGKGGTGKTSITGAFASLFKNIVLADCDVDAADLHLILRPKVLEKYDFFSGHEPQWIKDKCVLCGTCEEMCRFDAIKIIEDEVIIELESCEGCGVCVYFCPEEAFSFIDRWCGTWMISETSYGPMVHAKLGIGAENSGKLVSFVREQAKKIAQEKNIDKILIDGPPGIGCPVIASITGTSYVVIVTEPTMSGIHDLERVLSLARHFNVDAGIIINKWDIHKEMADRIIKKAEQENVAILGKIPYDPVVTKAQIQEKTIMDIESKAKEQIIHAYNALIQKINN